MVLETVRDLRRSQIVAAARAIVAGEGIEALTIGALEERLGYTRGVITYHFSSKDEIVHSVLASAVEEIDAATRHAVETGASPAEKVRAVIAANVRGFLERVEAARVLLSFWARLGADPRARAANAELYRTYRRRTRRLLEEGRAAGAFGPADANALAAVIVGVVIGIATQHTFDPKAIDVDAAIEEASRSVLARLAPPRLRGVNSPSAHSPPPPTRKRRR